MASAQKHKERSRRSHSQNSGYSSFLRGSMQKQRTKEVQRNNRRLFGGKLFGRAKSKAD
jgi:hypothetical protein